ncbi:MAG: C45 family autoproteolytic acyltransferase/hydrolase [Thiolinea sp.]
MKLRLFSCIYLALVFVLSGIQPVLAEVASALPIIHLNINKTKPGIVGTQLGHEVRRQFPDVEVRYDRYLAERFSQQAFNRIASTRLPAMLKQLDNHYRDELYGVANAWSLGGDNKLGDGRLSLAEYQVLNLLSDLGAAPNGSGFAVMGKASENGSPIVGRNLDWAMQTELRQLQAITVYQDNDKGIVSIGFAGLISVITGFNEQGLFVAGMNAEAFTPYTSNKEMSSDFSLLSFDLRKALETRSSIKKAARYLAGKHYAYNHNILLADQESVQVLEQNATRDKSLLRTWQSGLQYGSNRWDHRYQIAVVDCFLLPKNGNCTDPKDVTRWKTFNSLATFSARNPANTQDITKIMHNTDNHQYEIFNRNTLQSIIFQPEQSGLRLYTIPPDGQHPKHPVYTDYPELLPQVNGFNIQLLINALIWGILLTLLGVTVWQIRKN